MKKYLFLGASSIASFISLAQINPNLTCIVADNVGLHAKAGEISSRHKGLFCSEKQLCSIAGSLLSKMDLYFTDQSIFE